MKEGDLVVRKSHDKDITFKIMNIKIDEDGNEICELKGVNIRIEADSPADDLELSDNEETGSADQVFNRKINESIRKVISERQNNVNAQYDYAELARKKKPKEMKKNSKQQKNTKNSHVATEGDGVVNERELYFGRPGKILHVDGDPEYLEICLKTYKELKLEAVGKIVKESLQPKEILELVKEHKPDIVVITGHDGMVKGTRDYIDLDNYRNSRHFVDSVAILRNYEPNYDNLVIFAGACQSCYEALLDAGANFASSPSRVLIHCLDPVMVCEKVAYTNFQSVVSIKDVIDNTITGIKGVGGLETRGKYREGYPKSQYLK